jgi:protein SCO1/2
VTPAMERRHPAGRSAGFQPALPPTRPAGCRRNGRLEAGAPVLLLALLVTTSAFAQTASTPAKLPGKVAIAQKLGSQVPLDLMFRDETGKVVRLREYFGGKKPVLLHFVYYNCPMLCPMVLEGTTSMLTELKFNVGEEFDVITVSIDPRDKPEAALAMKDKYVKRYGRLSAASGWHFLTAHETAIKTLADSVGFQFAYDGQADQFAHGAALLVITPEGKTSRYFYGFEFKPRDVRLALVEAASGKIGTVADQVLLLCYHYDPAIGKYSRNAMNFMRAGGVATVLALGGFIFVMFRKETEPR